MKYVFDADMGSLPAIMEAAEQSAKECGCTQKQTMDILLAVEELAVNIINYAYCSSGGSIEMTLHKDNGKIILNLSDSGQEFNPLETEKPNITSSLDEREFGGLGIYLVKQTVQSLEYQRKDDKNIVTASFLCG